MLLPGRLFRTRRKIENLDRDPPIVPGLDERFHDRIEVDLAHAGPAQIHILCMKMPRRLWRTDGSGRERSLPVRCSALSRPCAASSEGDRPAG